MLFSDRYSPKELPSYGKRIPKSARDLLLGKPDNMWLKSNISVEEALKIAKDRDGFPKEDDWEVAEAALVLANEVERLRENES